MVKFLNQHKQLKAVMIRQVQDLIKLSVEWNLTKEERHNLYYECAEVLQHEGDYTGAFNLYYQALKIIDSEQSKTLKKDIQKKIEALVANAIKSPAVVNFEEILNLDTVKDAKKKQVVLFTLLDNLLKKD